MRRALPKASFFAFTGTPLDKRDRNTYRHFSPPGERYLDAYSIRKAEDDNEIVPVKYASRLAQLQVVGKSLDHLFEDLFYDKTKEEKALLKKKYATIETLSKADRRIERIAHDMVEHFNTKIRPNGFKSQIVASDRIRAIKYKEILFVVSLGGDGCFLDVSNRIARYGIPIIGVNYGRVGYLCKIKPTSEDSHLIALFDIIKNIATDSLKLEYRTRISAELNGEVVADALNEISIGGINRTVYLSMSTKGLHKEIHLKAIGDGIIFSTRTGSTAYNVNAGGSVLLSDDVFSIVANNSIFQSDKLPVNTKSLITSSEISFNIEIINKKKDNIPFLVADGQRTIQLYEDDRITIKKSKYFTKFILI